MWCESALNDTRLDAMAKKIAGREQSGGTAPYDQDGGRGCERTILRGMQQPDISWMDSSFVRFEGTVVAAAGILQQCGHPVVDGRDVADLQIRAMTAQPWCRVSAKSAHSLRPRRRACSAGSHDHWRKPSSTAPGVWLPPERFERRGDYGAGGVPGQAFNARPIRLFSASADAPSCAWTDMPCTTAP